MLPCCLAVLLLCSCGPKNIGIVVGKLHMPYKENVAMDASPDGLLMKRTEVMPEIFALVVETTDGKEIKIEESREAYYGGRYHLGDKYP
jgi:hypothetical protein